VRSLRNAILAGSAALTLAVGVGVGVANCTFPRPNGTYAGVLQLQKRLETTSGTQYFVDPARMDRNIEFGDGTGLVSVLFSADLTTWAVTEFIGHGNSSGWICGTADAPRRTRTRT
jgi:hypothetical protein